MPPIQHIRERHNKILRDKLSRSERTVEPVVVIPETDSKMAPAREMGRGER